MTLNNMALHELSKNDEKLVKAIQSISEERMRIRTSILTFRRMRDKERIPEYRAIRNEVMLRLSQNHISESSCELLAHEILAGIGDEDFDPDQLTTPESRAKGWVGDIRTMGIPDELMVFVVQYLEKYDLLGDGFIKNLIQTLTRNQE